MVARDDWRRYLAPAAFLLVVTVAVILIRAGVESGRHGSGGSAPPPPPTRTQPPPSTAATTTTKQAPARRYWTVRAGDTFGVISSQTGVPVATIEQLNPTVKSTSLHIGEKIRIK